MVKLTEEEEKDISGLTAFENSNSENSEPVKKTRKPYTKRNSVKQDSSDEIIQPFTIVDKDTCTIIAGLLPFTLLSIYTGKKDYELSPEEKEKLAPLWDKLIIKYLPKVAGQYSEETSLIMAVSALLIMKSGILTSLFNDKEKPKNVEFRED